MGVTAAVPDPRFRDQLAGPVLVARCENFREVEQQPCTGQLRYRWGQSQAACDACGAWCGVAVAAWVEVQPTAGVEARVQAAANQRAAENEQATLDRARQILRDHGHGIGAACLPPCWDPERRAARAAALASPAPAPRAEEDVCVHGHATDDAHVCGAPR